MKQEKVKSLTGVKNAILKHKKVWLTIDGKNWVYVEMRKSGIVRINYGLDADDSPNLHHAVIQIYDFLSFKHSTDLL